MSDVCVMCTWYTLSAGAPDDRPRPAGPPAPTGRSPDSVRAVRFRLRSAFAPSPRSRVQVPRPRGSWLGAGRILVPPGTRGHPFVEPMRSGSHAVQRRVSAAVRQGPTTPTRRPHASGQVINGSCALPARGAGASVAANPHADMRFARSARTRRSPCGGAPAGVREFAPP